MCHAGNHRCPGGGYLVSGPGSGHAMTISGFAELTLETDDLEQMRSFYEGVLGLEVLSDDEPDRLWLQVSDHARLGLWTPGRKEFGDRGGRHVHFAFSSTPGRIDDLVGRLRANDVEVRGPVEHPGGDRSIYFKDPAGNLVEAWDFLHRGDGARDGMDAL